MTILYLKTDIHFEALKVGGSISHMLGMIKGFTDCHKRVIVATSVDHPELDTICDKKYLLSMPKFLQCLRWKINCILSSFFFLPLTLYLIYKYQPNYIYQRYSPFNFTGIFAQYLSNIPLILEYNGSEVWADKAWLEHSKKQQFLMRYMAWSEEKIIALSYYISVVSQVLKDELIKRYKIDNIRVTPNGVDISFFSPFVTKKYEKKASLVIGFSSTFRPWHGINIIQYLITQCAEHALDVHMLLIGNGHLYEQLVNATKHAKNHVTFLGEIPHTDVPSYLAMCDAFICPTQPNQDGSPFFGCPTKLFEYASMAKPIITSNIAETNALLPKLLHIDQAYFIDQYAGICVEPTNKEGFLRACLLLANLSNEQRNNMGSTARNHVITHYQWSIIAERLINSLQD